MSNEMKETKSILDLLREWNPAKTAVNEINKQVAKAESDLAALRENAQRKDDALNATRSAIKTTTDDDNLIRLGKQLESDKSAAGQVMEQISPAESDLAVLKENAQGKKATLDGIETSIREIAGQGVIIEALVNEFASITEEHNIALAQVAELEETSKGLIDQRDAALARPPIEKVVVRDPTPGEIRTFLTKEGKNFIKESEEYRAIRGELDDFKEGLKTAEGIEKLLTGADPEALTAYLVKKAPKFDPANLSDEDLEDLKKLVSWIFNSEDEKAIAAYNAIFPDEDDEDKEKDKDPDLKKGEIIYPDAKKASLMYRIKEFKKRNW